MDSTDRSPPLTVPHLDLNRNDSPPRNFTIKGDRIFGQRSNSSAHLRTETHSVMKRALGSQTLESPGKRIEASQSEKLSEGVKTLSGLSRVGFDKTLRTLLKKRLKEAEPPLTLELLSKKINDYCKDYVGEIFFREKKPLQITARFIQKQESPRTQLVWEAMVTRQDLIKPFIERLKVLKSVLITYINLNRSSTVFSLSLLNYIDALISENSLKKIVAIFNNDTQYDIEVLKMGRKALNQTEWESIFEKLRNFSDYTSAKKDRENIKLQINSSSLDNIAIASIPSTKFQYANTALLKSVLSAVTCSQIELNLATRRENYKKFTFIEKDEKYEMDVAVPENEPNKELYFLNRLIKAIVRFGWHVEGEGEKIFQLSKVDMKKFQKDAEALDSEQLKKQYSLTSLSLEEIEILKKENNCESVVPSTKLLKACTPSAWNIGDDFIRLRFQKLFENPYWTKLDEKTKNKISHKKKSVLELDVVDRGNFHVVQEKIYAVFLKKDITDSGSHVTNSDRKLAKIWFRWHIQSIENEFSAYMEIKKIKLIDVSLQEKRDIVHALTDDEGQA